MVAGSLRGSVSVERPVAVTSAGDSRPSRVHGKIWALEIPHLSASSVTQLSAWALTFSLTTASLQLRSGSGTNSTSIYEKEKVLTENKPT
jgi:hypothetical protein